MGRPTKLTPQVQAKIVSALQAGNYFDTACGYAGITKQTGYNWMAKGADANSGKFFDFFNAVEKASADAEVGTVAVIKKVMPETWQAAAWWLERRFPAKWGRRVQEHQGKDGNELKVIVQYDDYNPKTS